MTGPLLVCFAIPQEAKPFRRIVAGRSEIHILMTGMGRENARRAVQALLDRMKPAHVFTCGFAGALDPMLRVGDVLFRTDVREMAAALEKAEAKAATFCSSDRIAITPAEKRALRGSIGADAVEMESEFIQAACREAGVPSTVVRAISDEAEETLPLDFNQLLTPEMALSPGKLAVAVLKRPGSIPGLMRLGRNSAKAAESLSSVLCQVIG
jgi:adenosylhomocysteine nucleosidase